MKKTVALFCIIVLTISCFSVSFASEQAEITPITISDENILPQDEAEVILEEPETEVLEEDTLIENDPVLLEESIIDSGTVGDNLSWEIVDTDTGRFLTISGHGKIPDLSTRGYPWSSYEDTITDIILEQGITRIGTNAFRSFEELNTVEMPEGLKTIGEYAFAGSGKLQTAVLPDGFQSLGVKAFYKCTGLTSVTFPASMGFIGESAFRECTSLKTVELPDGIKKINGFCFYGCTSLSTVKLPDNLQVVSEGSFGACKSLSSVNFPDTLVAIYESAFEETGLKKITLPKKTFVYESAFYNCSKLTSVTIPQGITVKIDGRAFSECKNLSKLVIKDSAAYICPDSLTKTDKADDFTIYGYSGSNVHVYACKHKIPFVSIGSTTKVSSFTLNRATIDTPLDTKPHFRLKVEIKPVAASNWNTCIQWTSSNTRVAKVDKNGRVTPLRFGTAVITATSALDPNLTASCTVKVKWFADVRDETAYYYKPVYWGKSKKVLTYNTGTEGCFGVKSKMNRLSLVQWLYRLAGRPEVSGKLSFKDADLIERLDPEFCSAVLWAVKKGIVTGYSDNTFRPHDHVTRKQAVLMLYRYAKKPAVSGTIKFKDVNYKKTSDSYKAILWATQKKITNGKTATTFDPEGSVTRPQMITFMYRYANP